MILLVIPFFNEEQAIKGFLEKLTDSVNLINKNFHFIFVDDFSNDLSSKIIGEFLFSNNVKYTILKNKANRGNQYSINTGINFIFINKLEFEKLIIMDSDGEDDPLMIEKLLNYSNKHEIVVAKRGNRNESKFVKILYFIYKLTFKVLTGSKLDFGNFTIISRKVAQEIFIKSFVHYPASLLKLKYDILKIEIDKGKRIGGLSNTNFQFLIYHAIFSIMEMSEYFFYRIIKLFVVLLTLLTLLSGYILYTKFILGITVSGWASLSLIGIIISELVILNTLLLGIMIIYSFKKTEKIEFKKIK